MSSEKRPRIESATSDLCHVSPLTSKVFLQSHPDNCNNRKISALFTLISDLLLSIAYYTFIATNTFSITSIVLLCD